MLSISNKSRNNYSNMDQQSILETIKFQEYLFLSKISKAISYNFILCKYANYAMQEAILCQ